MNAVLQGVWYNTWQAIGGGITDGTGGVGKGVLFLVIRCWTYLAACTTLGEVKLVAVVAIPATLGDGVVVTIRLANLRDWRSFTLCDGLSVIVAVISVMIVACQRLSVAVLGAVALRDSISSVAAIIFISLSDMVGTLQWMGITL